MVLWMVRAGRHGEEEQQALEKGLVTIGWNEFPDLSKVKSRSELAVLYAKLHPNTKKMALANEVGQIWRFLDNIKIDDLVALPLKHQSAIAIGKVESNYEYRKDLGEDIHHIRRVKWIKTIPRSEFDQDLLYSFGAFMTVCQIERNNAEARVSALLKGRPLPEEEEELEAGKLDIEQASRDQILKHISQKFKGHDLARLVEAVLQAQGYITTRSAPGPDGGVDILAGAGQLGFENPRICIQVKSSSSPVDAPTLRNLQGTMQNFNADQGLLISWGGFTSKAIEESRRTFFSVRLWDSGKLLDEILEHFEKLPDSLKTELPLKRIWTLVIEE
jgi:restriction system protein